MAKKQFDFSKPRSHFLLALLVATFVLIGLWLVFMNRIISSDNKPNEYAASERMLVAASAFRTLAMEEPALIGPVIHEMPIGLKGKSTSWVSIERAAWRTYFSGALIHVGLTQSTRPDVVYYNPYSDVLVLSSWEFPKDQSPHVKSICAIPADYLRAPKLQAQRRPAWLNQSAPLQALVANTRLTLKAIKEVSPINSSTTANYIAGFCTQDRQQQAELRLFDLVEGLGILSRPDIKVAMVDLISTTRGDDVSISRAFPKLSKQEAQLAAKLGAKMSSLSPVIALSAADRNGYFVLLASHKTAEAVVGLELCECGKGKSLVHLTQMVFN